MKAPELNNFSEIITAGHFFEEKSDEAKQLRLKYENIIKDIEEQKPIEKILEFGCGDGKFLQSLIVNKSFAKIRNIELTLIEPDLNYKLAATQRLTPYFTKKVNWLRQDLNDLGTGYNIILANHLRYYIDHLKVKIVKLVQALSYGGKLILTLPRFDNPLANLLEVLAQHKGVALSTNSAMQLFHVLYQYGFYYDTIDIHSVLRFENTVENKNKIISFVLGSDRALYSEPVISNFFDIYSYNQELVIPIRDQIIVVHA